MTGTDQRSISAPTAFRRPIATAAKPSLKGGPTEPGISFRSALLRARQYGSPTIVKAAPTSKARVLSDGLATGMQERVIATAPLLEQRAAGLAMARQPQVRSVAGQTVTPATNAAVLEAKHAGPVSSTGPGGRPMALSDFPRPQGDNGRGMHWVPITSTASGTVDRFVKEAKEMKIKWMVILNEDTNIGANDYLVKQLVANGIMPVMRLYTPNGRPIQGDIGAMVKHYRQLGVQYYQLYNEPNLNVENPDGVPNVDKYLDSWLPAAKAVTAAGGLPGLGALSPGGNYDDMEFLKKTFDRIKERGETASLNNAWLSMHNYTLNHPLDYAKDSNAFMKFKWYDGIIRDKLRRQMPIIGTEGGTHIGSADDKTFPAITEAKQVEMVTGAYRYMNKREPYNFAYTYWIIANEEGGGADAGFANHALFKGGGQSPIVDALKGLD